MRSDSQTGETVATNDTPGTALDTCLQRLAALKTGGFRTEVSLYAAEGWRVQIDTTPYVAVIAQALFELEFMNQKRGEDFLKYHQQILQFMWDFYGSIFQVPFEILFLT